jgi:hypothetical protein
VAADDLPGRAFDLAGPVGVDGQDPAELVQHHVMVPPTVALKVREAGDPAVSPVHHMMRLTPASRLIAPPGVLARLIAQRHQPPQVDRDVIGLALVRVLCLLVARWMFRTEGAIPAADYKD